MIFETLNVDWNKMVQSFGKRSDHNGGKREHILYLMRNSKGEVIRVGQCNNLNDRMHNYKNKPQSRAKVAGRSGADRFIRDKTTAVWRLRLLVD